MTTLSEFGLESPLDVAASSIQSPPTTGLPDALWVELVDLCYERMFAAHLRNVGRKYAGAAVVADWHSLVEEIIGDLQVVIVTKSQDWAGLPDALERRKYCFGVAKNLTYQKVDKLRAEQRKSDAATIELRADLSESVPVLGEGLTDAQIFSILRTRIVTTPGVRAIGFEKLIRKAHRDDTLKAQVAEALTQIRLGVEPETKPLVRLVVDWKAWAVDRLHQGHNLSVTDAVEDGAFPSHKLGYRKLYDWFATHLHRERLAETSGLCGKGMLATGLLDHMEPDVRPKTAEMMAATFNLKCGLTNPIICPKTGCPLHPYHGVNLDSARAELATTKGKG